MGSWTRILLWRKLWGIRFISRRRILRNRLFPGLPRRARYHPLSDLNSLFLLSCRLIQKGKVANIWVLFLHTKFPFHLKQVSRKAGIALLLKLNNKVSFKSSKTITIRFKIKSFKDTNWPLKCSMSGLQLIFLEFKVQISLKIKELGNFWDSKK